MGECVTRCVSARCKSEDYLNTNFAHSDSLFIQMSYFTSTTTTATTTTTIQHNFDNVDKRMAFWNCQRNPWRRIGKASSSGRRRCRRRRCVVVDVVASRCRSGEIQSWRKCKTLRSRGLEKLWKGRRRDEETGRIVQNFFLRLWFHFCDVISGQSYKHFTIVIYDTRVVICSIF